MIDGILLFFIILLIYSFWWFDFCFLNKNIFKFKQDFEKVKSKCDIVIIFNAGGWGTVDYKNAFDLNPFAIFIKNYLNKKGFKSCIIQYFRTEDHLIGRLGYIKDYVFAFEKQVKRISSIVKETDKKIILLGLSNGALIADEVMENMKGAKNIFSIELGKPFFRTHSKNENILLINNFEDDLCNGNTLELFKSIFIFAPIRWIKNFILGEGVSLGLAVKVKGHNYPLDKYKEKIIKFIDERII
jgi:hypothetical protein